MLGGVILGAVAVALVGWLVAQARQGAATPAPSACPACRGELEPVLPADPDAPRRSYEVAGCRACPSVVLTVHGVPARWAYCPACFQRTLEVTCEIVPSEDPDLEVEAAERCHLCGHEDLVLLWFPEVEIADPRRGRVIAFPKRRLRAGDG